MYSYVIYDHPRDCPHHWVVRRWFSPDGQHMFAGFGCAFDTLEAARAALPTGLYNMGNAMESDPVVAEVWM